MHYSLGEVVGQHHSLFCQRAESESQNYRAFWASLNRGEIIDTVLLGRGKLSTAIPPATVPFVLSASETAATVSIPKS